MSEYYLFVYRSTTIQLILNPGTHNIQPDRKPMIVMTGSHTSLERSLKS